MQRVEKKMRMQLHLQRFQLRLRQLRFERGLLHFGGTEVVVVQERVRADNDERSDDEIDVKSVAEMHRVVATN